MPLWDEEAKAYLCHMNCLYAIHVNRQFNDWVDDEALFKKWTRRDATDSRKQKGVDEGSIKKINEVCVEMMNELCFENNVKHVQTHVIVTLVPTAHIGYVADKAEEYQARWLILDRRLRKESESCLACLDCNIIIIDHAIPTVLRLIDESPREQVPDNTDVFTIRHPSYSSISTSSGHEADSSFNISSSLGSIATRDSMSSRPSLYSNSSAVARDQEQRTVSLRAPSPIKVKAVSHDRNSFDAPNKIQMGSEITTEIEPPAVDRSTAFPVHHGYGDSKQASRSEEREPELRSKTNNARNTEQHTVPSRPSFDNHRMFVKSPIQTKGTSQYLDETRDAFSQRRKSVDSRIAVQRYSEIPSITKPLSMNLGMNSINHVKPTEPVMVDRMSSVRRAMSVSIKKAPIPPPLCSVCRHRAPVFGKPPRKFSYPELERATNRFASANFLSEGGFGMVYRGVLEDGQTVAVKKHRKVSAQGASEFCSEVEVLSCAQHRNLVMLIGYCMDKEWVLVYEFVCNGSLEQHLHGNGMEVMSWHHRQKVAVGAARGLRYLHEDCRMGCIIHRDFRPNNILLTHDFEPMVGDFGLARWQVDGQSAEETRIVGTFGYLAPEYTQTGQITEKTDVYAFGVLLMELISGEKAIDLAKCTGQQSLSQWASPLMDGDMINRLVDPKLDGNCDEQEVECMMFVAGSCISPNPESRPRMSQVLRMLEGDSLTRTAKSTHTHHRKDSGCSYEKFRAGQRIGTPTADERQLKSKNALKPPLPPQAIKAGVNETMRQHTLNQKEKLPSSEYRAYLEDAVVEYIRSSQELPIPKRGTFHTDM